MTVTELDTAGNNLASRFFTASDFAKNKALKELGEAPMVLISHRLVERGQSMGVSR